MAAPDPMVQLEAGLMQRLGATSDDVSSDLALATLLPGGLHSRSAGGTQYPFGTLTLIRMDEDHTFGKVWRYRFRYGFSVSDESESIDATSAALQRVFELLQDADAYIAMEDFKVMFIRRKARTGLTPTQTGQTYQRITDEYQIEVAPNE